MGCGASRIGPDLPAANNWKQWPAGSYPTLFVELASPEDADDTAGNGFLFVESCAYNKIFDADNFYVPVQHTDSSCHVYRVSVSDGSKKAERLHQVVKKSDGEKMISPFGSALSDEGVLWLCCFNENLVCGVDLSSGEMVVEATVPAPNDICVSDDGKYVYAGCGSWLGKVPLAPAGTIWRVTTAAPYTCKKVVGGAQGAMAGIAEVKGKLFCAHLHRMSVYGAKRKIYTLSGLRKQIWTGLCSQDADPEKVDKFYLADNLAFWDAEKPRKVILTPALPLPACAARPYLGPVDRGERRRLVGGARGDDAVAPEGGRHRGGREGERRRPEPGGRPKIFQGRRLPPRPPLPVQHRNGRHREPCLPP